MLGLGEKSVNHGICLSAFLPGVPDLYAVATTGIRRGEACVVNGPGIEPFPALLYIAPVRPDANGSGFRGSRVRVHRKSQPKLPLAVNADP